MLYMEEKRNDEVLGLVPQMDEEGQKAQPTKITASLMLSKDQQCMVSGKLTKHNNITFLFQKKMKLLHWNWDPKVF